MFNMARGFCEFKIFLKIFRGRPLILKSFERDPQIVIDSRRFYEILKIFANV